MPKRPRLLPSCRSAAATVAAAIAVAGLAGCAGGSTAPVTPSATSTPTPTPTLATSPAAVTIDGSEYDTIDDDQMDLLTTDPDSYKGAAVILYGYVNNYAASGDACRFFASYVDNTDQPTRQAFDDLGVVAVAFPLSGDADGDGSCTEFAGLAEDDHVRFYGRVNGLNQLQLADGSTLDALDLSVVQVDELDPLP